MSQSTTTVEKTTTETVEEVEEVTTAGRTEEATELLEDIDELLAELDEVLESNETDLQHQLLLHRCGCL